MSSFAQPGKTVGSYQQQQLPNSWVVPAEIKEETYNTPWLPTNHSFIKLKSQAKSKEHDLESRCTHCGKTMRELLESIPCNVRRIEDVERENAELRRKLLQLQGPSVPTNSAAATSQQVASAASQSAVSY